MHEAKLSRTVPAVRISASSLIKPYIADPGKDNTDKMMPSELRAANQLCVPEGVLFYGLFLIVSFAAENVCLTTFLISFFVSSSRDLTASEVCFTKPATSLFI